MINSKNSRGLEAFVRFADKSSSIGVWVLAVVMAFMIGLQFFK